MILLCVEICLLSPCLLMYVTFDLLFLPHIETITSKANKVLGLIKRNLWNCPKSVKETAHKTPVRPKLQCACSAWDSHYQKDKAALERVQRKTARFVTGNYDRTTSLTEMLQDLQWDTLETMRRHVRLSTIYKMCRSLLDGDWGDYLIPSRERRTRGSHDFKFVLPKGQRYF